MLTRLVIGIVTHDAIVAAPFHHSLQTTTLFPNNALTSDSVQALYFVIYLCTLSFANFICHELNFLTKIISNKKFHKSCSESMPKAIQFF